MPIFIDINDAGQAVLKIADADGELFAYRFRLLPPGYSLWALEVIRADADAVYRVAEETPGRWDCTCPVQTKGKRSQRPCKHIQAARLFRSWLRTFTGETHDRNQRVAV